MKLVLVLLLLVIRVKLLDLGIFERERVFFHVKRGRV